MEQIFALLSAGGDAATIAFVFVVWRLDRRLLVIETVLANLGLSKKGNLNAEGST